MVARTDSKRGRYEWKWFEEAASEPAVVPQRWAQNGDRETPSEGEEQFYAIEVKTGLVLQYLIDQNGKSLQGPLREKDAIRVLYVTSDGTRATVREIIASHEHYSRLETPEGFRSIVTKERSAGEPFECPKAAKNAIEGLYSGGG